VKLRHLVTLLGLLVVLVLPFKDARSNADFTRAAADLDCAYAAAAPIAVLSRFVFNVTGYAIAIADGGRAARCTAPPGARPSPTGARVVPREETSWWRRLIDGPMNTVRDFADAWLSQQGPRATSTLPVWALGLYLAAAMLLLWMLPSWSELEADWWGGYLRSAIWIVPLAGSLLVVGLAATYRTLVLMAGPALGAAAFIAIVVVCWLGFALADSRRQS
jgi:hypothetical protein